MSFVVIPYLHNREFGRESNYPARSCQQLVDLFVSYLDAANVILEPVFEDSPKESR